MIFAALDFAAACVTVASARACAIVAAARAEAALSRL